NSRDDAFARPGCEPGARARGSSRGSPAGRASGPGLRPYSPLCRKAQSRSAGDADYADRDEITFGNTCTYDGIPGPCVPSCEGSIIGQWSGVSAPNDRIEGEP